MNKDYQLHSQKLFDYINESAPPAIRERYRALPDRIREADYGELDESVIVIDTETTGVSFRQDELIQIAAARLERGEIVDWYISFVNPGRPIPEEIQHLTHISDADVASAPSPAEALIELVTFVGDRPLVAHNAAFDRHFVTRHPEGSCLTANLWLDSLELARIALPRMKSHRLKDLIAAFGGPKPTHRADDDVTATCVLYRLLLAAVEAMPRDLVRLIATMADESQWPTVAVFRYFAEREDDQLAPKLFNLRRHRQSFTKTLREPVRRDAELIVEEDEQPLRFADEGEIAREFSGEGALGRAYEEYETRAEQRAMAQAVNQAFSRSENLVVEAGTGVGKSMAYLVPAVKLARKNNIGVGVATKTNNLLDQLVSKELPLLDEVMGGVSYACLKGFTHYLCLRKVNRIVESGPTMVEVMGELLPQAPVLAAVLSFVEQSEFDDIDTLKTDYRRIPRVALTTTSHECLRRKCPFFGRSCYVWGSRLKAEQSDIVVTNHSLLFRDLATDGGLLPPLRFWVIDEAHGAEAEGRRAFSSELSVEVLQRISRRVSSEEGRVNVYLRVERTLSRRQDQEPDPNQEALIKSEAGESLTLLYSLSAKARACGLSFASAVDEFAHQLKGLLFFEGPNRAKGYERVELWINDEIRASDVFTTLVAHGKLLTESIRKLIKANQDLVSLLEGYENVAALQQDIAAITYELKDQLLAAELILFSPDEDYAYAANLNKHKDRFQDSLTALPINIGSQMVERLYSRSYSAIFTSATLSVDGSFAPFTEAMGLGESECAQVRCLELPSSYDFDTNMEVYVVKDMPEPTAPSYLTSLQKLLVEIHRLQGGSVLTLFTNRREMESCYKVATEALKKDDLRLVCQRRGSSVKGLRDDFLSDTRLSLFALKSFWEGFDAPGSTLRSVVIPKLPFKKPSDPLSCERTRRDSHAWAHYVLPEAVLEVKQAAGRLIRKADDQGTLILADSRLSTKAYGQKFLRSLPSRNIHIVSVRELFANLSKKHGF